ncbi:MAG: hypothetical protein WC476_11915 [Phycisphaerae bacterium]
MKRKISMPIKIFISRPTMVTKSYETQYAVFEQYLVRKGYRPQRLGSDQYTMDAPLRGVMNLMKTCKGAIVLGYPQYRVTAAILNAADAAQKISITIPTPWNQIEAALAFKQRIPVLVVAHDGVSGGIFDYGITGEYVHTTNLGAKEWYKTRDFLGIFSEWEKRIK